jgi:hypothetical protein
MSFSRPINFQGNCPLCNASYIPRDVRVVAEIEEKHLLHIACRQCQTSLLAYITFSNSGTRFVEVVTDLQSSEAEHFSKSDPVTPEDVLNLNIHFQRENVVTF